MGPFYSLSRVWVRSADSPQLSCVLFHQSITSLLNSSVSSHCFSNPTSAWHIRHLFFIFASILPLFFGISASFHKWFCRLHCFILVSPSPLSQPCLPLFLLLVSSCLNLYWCFSFRQLMENKITTIERGAFQDLKELERLWVPFCHQIRFWLSQKWGKKMWELHYIMGTFCSKQSFYQTAIFLQTFLIFSIENKCTYINQ